MILTIAVVVVNSEAFVDPRLDTSTSVIRDVFHKTAGDRDSFELLTTNVVAQSEEDIARAVSILIERSSVDWIIVVGGIGFERRDCTPRVCQKKIPMGDQILKDAHVNHLFVCKIGDRQVDRAPSSWDNSSHPR